ncbi:telomeric repeat-binding factor 1 isoform X2 [Rhinatrema bivittatum]|uniref:telomeric repeat-binding factor 1 isoform X2 n=1 Tax=Rhinatrema bivittatum TaxID=194408 RepID=UPI00112D49E3|nr:telomeric repeat-binding factor 1 isoform X2 [Rhinatrema bivittatum]
MEMLSAAKVFSETFESSQDSANTESFSGSATEEALERPQATAEAAGGPYDSATEAPPGERYESATGEPSGGPYASATEEPRQKPHESTAEESTDAESEPPPLEERPDSATKKKPGGLGDSSSEETSERPPDSAGSSSCPLSASLFSEAVEVASGWVLDFMVSCLYRYFTEDRMTEFARSRDAAEAFIHGLSRLNQHQRKKVYVCQFLARIAEGKNLDVQFEKDERITPLESALLIWNLLRKLQGRVDTFHEEIQLLIQVQAIAVCMEKGYFKQAAEVLERQFAEEDLNKSLRMKLAMIINRKDPYHQFLQNFSYNRMMNKIKSYIGMILNENPSDFLMKAAIKVMQTKRRHARISESWENGSGINFKPVESSENEDDGISIENEKHSQKKKRKREANQSQSRLFSLTNQMPWNPVQSSNVKKSTDTDNFAVRRRNYQEHFKNKKNEMSLIQNGSKKKQIWLWEEDRKLKEGVKKFGVGNWTKIVAHYDFKNRTSVMLKDRWRTMKKLNMVSSDNED